MRAFSIFEEVTGESVIRLAEIGTPADDNFYWLDAEAAAERTAGRHERAWMGRLLDMLAAAAKYGFYDEATGRVKAHVENDD